MKKVFVFIFSISVLLLGCSKDDDSIDSSQIERPNFPAHIEEYGKAFAKEFRQTIYNLNEMGVNSSELDNSDASREKIYNAIPSLKKNSVSIKKEPQIDPVVFAERYRNLTDKQIKFIERIIDEYGQSSSYEDLSNRLLNVNKDIYAQVPEIEQERLFYITAILYYGMKEVQKLEKQGQMPVTSHNMPIMKLKSGNESGGGFWGTCRQISTYAWNLAVGATYYTGEVVTAISTVAVTGFVLVTLCMTIPGDTNWDARCWEYSRKCIEKGWHQGRKMECDQCYRYCMNNKAWNWTSCPLD